MSAPSRKFPSFLWLLAVAAILGGSLFAARFFRQRAPHFLAAAAEVKAPPPAAWKRQEIEALSLEAPFPFGPGPNVSAQLPPEVREVILAWETRAASDPASGLQIQISHLKYRPDVEVNLDAAVEGAMQQAAAAAGDPEPDYDVKVTEISGLAARRVAYSRVRPPLHIDALFLHRGSELWQIQAVHLARTAHPVGQRLLESVQLAPAPVAAGVERQ